MFIKLVHILILDTIVTFVLCNNLLRYEYIRHMSHYRQKLHAFTNPYYFICASKTHYIQINNICGICLVSVTDKKDLITVIFH